MDWGVWDDIEPILIEGGIRPILAVIPDNRDKTLHFGEHADNFWHRVATWQARGWTIGLHGYQHRYITRNPGLVGPLQQSEFAGVPLPEQHVMLRSAAAIFRQHKIEPEVWIAPGHSFDTNTLVVLKQLGIRTISDGLSLFPYLDDEGMLWIPQQLGKFRSMPLGVWTVCIHLDEDPQSHVPRLRRMIQEHGSQFTNVAEIRRNYGSRRKHWVDGGVEHLLKEAKRSQRRIHAI
jgi:peptidoglycan/xylan/chitin deacetylase (PgdA/CDA1 family)